MPDAVRAAPLYCLPDRFFAERFARNISRLVRTVAETRTLNPRAIRLMPKFIAGETV